MVVKKRKKYVPPVGPAVVDVALPAPDQARSLRQVLERRQELDQDELRLVRAARAAGTSWADIGGELGVSGQAAQQRLGRRL